jgi:hypothetical protein
VAHQLLKVQGTGHQTGETGETGQAGQAGPQVEVIGPRLLGTPLRCQHGDVIVELGRDRCIGIVSPRRSCQKVAGGGRGSAAIGASSVLDGPFEEISDARRVCASASPSPPGSVPVEECGCPVRRHYGHPTPAIKAAGWPADARTDLVFRK